MPIKISALITSGKFPISYSRTTISICETKLHFKQTRPPAAQPDMGQPVVAFFNSPSGFSKSFLDCCNRSYRANTVCTPSSPTCKSRCSFGAYRKLASA